MIKYLSAYIIIVNISAFFLYGIDKKKASKKQWRITENTLLLCAAAGGSIGAWLGMKLFHHKTRHPKFYIGVPVIFLVQIIFFIYIYLNYYRM